MQREGQTVISILRDKILSGEFTAGKRLAEIPTSEALGVSRTPIRIAFRALAQEGLLVKLPRRGYQVREVTTTQISDSIEVRGVLEGLAARQAAEKGLTAELLTEFKACLVKGDNILDKGTIDELGIKHYQEMNLRFHDLLLQACDNAAVAAALQLNEHLPFASVKALAFNPAQLAREYQRLSYAHMQHHAIVEAIANGQSARAESLVKEHALATLYQAKRLQDEKHSQTVG